MGAIKIKGNKRVDDSTILYYIKTEVDKPLSRMQIRKDIEQIYSLGQFKDIQVDIQSSVTGLIVTFILEEIPSIGDIRIIGNDIVDSDDIRQKITMKPGETSHDHLITESIEEIKKLYHEKGYFFADIRIKTRTTSDNLIDVTVRIQEGKKVSIKKLQFTGNRHYEARKLLKQMETQEKTWYSFIDDSGIYQKDVLKLDLFRLEGYYQDRGFIRVRVSEPKIEAKKSEEAIYITIPIEEGPRYRVGTVEIRGDDTVPESDVRRVIKTQSGKIYNLSQVREDVLAIGDLYSQKGYAYADINPITKINDDKRTVDLAMEVDKGRKVYVGEISIIGNDRTLDNVIRREFRLREGDLFDSIRLKRSKQRINNLGYFEDVKIDTRRGKSPELIDIVVTVTERPTGSVSAGAGFSSVENLIFTGSISQNNLFGRGQRLNFSVALSSIRSDFNLNFTEPRIMDTDILGGIDLFNREQEFFTFDTRNRGAGFRLGKGLTEYDGVGFTYRFDEVEISDVDDENVSDLLKNETRITSRVILNYNRDTRDDFLNPSTGMRHVVGFQTAGGVLGGSNFVKFNYSLSYHRPLIWDFVLGVRGEIKVAEGYGGESLPAFERYFLGGPSTLRGFTVRDVGPKDVNDDPLGGGQSLLFNLEAVYPLSKTFRAFVFYDRGNVFGKGPDLSTTNKSISLIEMRHSIGVGVRFFSPFGPIGLAYGFKLDPAPGDEPAEFHFSAGGAF